MFLRALVFALSGIALIPSFAAERLTQERFPEGFFDKKRVEQGRTLSQGVCATCHVWPHPEILDKSSWLNGALPWMMTYCGLSPEALPSGIEGHLIKRSGAVSSQAIVSKSDFGKIIAYYVDRAPTKSEFIPLAEPLTETEQFAARPLLHSKSSPPAALMVQFDAGGKGVWVSSQSQRSLVLIDNNGATQQSYGLNALPVSITQAGEQVFVMDIGTFEPSEQPTGSLIELPSSPEMAPTVLLEDLHRPVHTSAADLDDDGKLDLIVSMFGWYGGRLSWFQAEAESHREHLLFPKSGSLRTMVDDVDADGDLDITALVAQGTESIIQLLNDGHGKFEQRTLIQRHPAFGFTYFDFTDMDGDGTSELVTTNGDNGDYPSPTKPYHGVRIFKRTKTGLYDEARFLPLPGATKVCPGDFDHDGDIDLAAIAYYADFRESPDQGFVYLENTGDLRFKFHTVAGTRQGRWLTMDSGDFDGDGDDDIILGSKISGPGRADYIPPRIAAVWRTNNVEFLLVENKAR